MKRNWIVRPDPETGIADRHEIIEAIMDGEAMLHRAGGVLTIVVDRVDSDFPGEMFNRAAVFEWKDRTDARDDRGRASSSTIAPDPTPAELEDSLARQEEFLAEAATSEDDSAMEPSAR